MITEKDLQEAIAECQGVRKPDAKTCMMLAAFMTIKDHMYPDDQEEPIKLPQYSYAESPVERVSYYSDSEFSQVVDGKNMDDVWGIIDELMTTLQVLQPRLYNSVIRKIDSI